MEAFHEKRKNDIPILVSLAKDRFEFSAHWHNDLEIVYVIDGYFEIGINNTLYMLSQGSLAVVNKNNIHYYSGKNCGKSVMLIIKRSILSEEMILSGEIAPYITADMLKEVGLSGKISDIIESLLSEENSLYKDTVARGLILQLLGYLYRSFGGEKRSKKSEDDNMRFQKLLSYLNENPEISLNEAADYIKYSVWHFSRIFQSYTGQKFSAYMNECRISKAEEMLKNTNKTVTETAFECGFNSVRNFNRVFKKMKGFTPKEIR